MLLPPQFSPPSPKSGTRSPQAPPRELRPPNLEDRSAIQAAISEVLQRIAANEIDPRRAGLLLYGLQIASLNLPRPDPSAKPAKMVEEVIEDPTYGPIAPRAEEEPQQKSVTEQLLEDLERQFPDDPIAKIHAVAEQKTGNSKLVTRNCSYKQLRRRHKRPRRIME